MRVLSTARGVAAALLLVAAAGCGDGPKVVPVTGTLTYKGEPVPNVYIQFLPEHGRQSWAETDERGRFKVNYDAQQDGAVVGKHKVWVEPRPAARDPGGAATRPAVPKDQAGLFAKYGADKSTYTVEITPRTRELTLAWD